MSSSKGRNRGDLVGLGVNVALGDDRAVVVCHRRQQVHLLAVALHRAAQGLAVNRVAAGAA